MDNNARASPSLQSIVVVEDLTGRFLGNLEIEYEYLRFRLRVLGGE